MPKQNSPYDRSSQHGSVQYAGITGVYNGDIQLQTALGHQAAMIGDRDPTVVASFDEVARQYGLSGELDPNAAAKQMYDELNALLAQIATIRASIKQGHDRLS